MDNKVLLVERNVISLRSAYVVDIGSLVEFRLNPADLASKVPKGRKWWAPQDYEWVKEDSVWVYRHLMTAAGELDLKNGPPCIEQDVKPMKFNKSPELELVWADSGHSVALFINSEPWAFIDEATHRGFSKGIIVDTDGRQWDQNLFELIFKGA